MSKNDELTEAELDSLVREAVFDAAEGRTCVTGQPTDELIAMPLTDLKPTVQRAAMTAIRTLADNKTLLSGPLKEAVSKLAETHARTEALYAELKRLDDGLSELLSGEAPVEFNVPGPVVLPALQQELAPPTPMPPPATKPVPIDLAAQLAKAIAGPVEPSTELVKVDAQKPVDANLITISVMDFKTGQIAPAKPKKAARPTQAAPGLDAIIPGVVFKKTTPEFIAFWKEFAAGIMAGPVTPRWILLTARKNGYMVNFSSIDDRVKNMIGGLVKGKTPDGEHIWSLSKIEDTGE